MDMESYLIPALIIYVVLNVVSFMLYNIDKFKANHNKWRISENTLIVSGLIAPFGAVIGMHVAHHKTRKIKFKLNYLFLILHIILIAYLVLR